MSNQVIEVIGLGKAYGARATAWQRLRSLLVGPPNKADQWALSNITFSLARGQCLGVVGDNGAGKSTLLKLIAGTLHPTAGTVRRTGRLTAILELGAGFHPEFTGRQNLYFGGALIGIPADRMRMLENETIAFAELEDAIDRPVKTYSSGMIVRLAFALITAVEPEVLIVDEALAVGDQHFQRKCQERIDAFRKNGCSILLCSHSLYHVRHLCDVAIWIDKGMSRAFGPTANVLAAYETHVLKLNAASRDLESRVDPKHQISISQKFSENHARLVNVTVAGLGPGNPPLLETKDLVITVTAHVPSGELPHMAVMIERADMVGITAVGTHVDNVEPRPIGDDQWQATVTFPSIPLYSGEYLVTAFLFDHTGTLVYEQWSDCQRFMIIYPTREIGIVRLPHSWT